MFEFKGYFLQKITNKNYNVDHAQILNKKLVFEFAKGMYFDEKVVKVIEINPSLNCLNHLLSRPGHSKRNFSPKQSSKVERIRDMIVVI